MRCLAVAVLIACLTPTACRSQAQPLSPILSKEPFSSLAGIRLGMTAEELLNTRPGVELRPRFGYGEKVGGTVIHYNFRLDFYDGQIPPTEARVQDILAMDTLARGRDVRARDKDLRATFEEEVRKLDSSKVACFTIENGPEKIQIGVVSHDGFADYVEVVTVQLASSPEPLYTILMVGTSFIDPLTRGWAKSRTPVPCRKA